MLLPWHSSDVGRVGPLHWHQCKLSNAKISNRLFFFPIPREGRSLAYDFAKVVSLQRRGRRVHIYVMTSIHSCAKTVTRLWLERQGVDSLRQELLARDKGLRRDVRFRRGVLREPREEAADHRANENNVSAAAGRHWAAEHTHEVGDGSDVDGNETVTVALGPVEERAVLRDARVVHQPPIRRGHNGLDASWCQEVRSDWLCLHGVLFGKFRGQGR